MLFVVTPFNSEKLLLSTTKAQEKFHSMLDRRYGGDYSGVKQRFNAMLEAQATLNEIRNLS